MAEVERMQGDSDEKTGGENPVESGKDEQATVKGQFLPTPFEEGHKGKEKVRHKAREVAKPGWFSSLCCSLAPSNFSLASPKFGGFSEDPRTVI